jgi:hypothetical protein
MALSTVADPAARTLTFRLLRGTFLRDFEGSWAVDPDGRGGSRVVHRLAVQPLMPLPPPVAEYTKRIFVQQVEALLQDLASEVDRCSSGAGGAGGAAAAGAAAGAADARRQLVSSSPSPSSSSSSSSR